MEYAVIMNLVLNSDRLLLRPLADTDLDLGYAIFMDPAVMKYIAPGKTFTKDVVNQELRIALKRGAGGQIGVWCVLDRSTDEKLGSALLLPLPIEEGDTNWDLLVGEELPCCEVEIGYTLKKSAWGKGYATEACKRLLKFAFEETQLQEVVAVTDPENKASQNVLRKSVLIEGGVRRAYATQVSGFRITRRQWSQMNQESS